MLLGDEKDDYDRDLEYLNYLRSEVEKEDSEHRFCDNDIEFCLMFNDTNTMLKIERRMKENERV